MVVSTINSKDMKSLQFANIAFCLTILLHVVVSDKKEREKKENAIQTLTSLAHK